MCMTKKMLFLFLAAGLASAAYGADSEVATTDGLDTRNLIPNGSFEEANAEGKPVGWGLGGAEGLTWAIDNQVSHSGRQSLRITGRDVAPGSLRAGAYPNEKIRLRPNRVYNLEVWVKAQDVKFARQWPFGYVAMFEAQAENGNRLHSTSLCVPNGSYGWRRYSSLFKIPEESKVPEPYRTLVPTILTPQPPDGLSGTLWIDSVSLREIEVVSAYESVRTPQLIAHYEDASRTPDGELALLFAPPTKKIMRATMPDRTVLTGGRTGSISLARNEHEAIQLVMVPLWDKDITRKVQISTAPLRHKQTGDIPADVKVTWHPVGYMGMHEEGQLSTRWPDILLPAGDFSLRGEDLQPIWFDVHTGMDVPAGDYQTQVTIRTSGSPHVLIAGIDVHVYDFAVPRDFTMQTAFGAFFVASQDMLFEHRLIPWHIANGLASEFHMFQPKPHTFREFEQVRPYLEAQISRWHENGARVFPMDLPLFKGWYGGGPNSPGAHGGYNLVYTEEQAAYIVRYHRQFARWLRDKGLLQDTYVYLWDEPQPHIYDNMRTIRKLIHEADPEIRCMIASGLHEELDDIVDFWTVHTWAWDKNQPLARKLVDGGDEVWWYITDGPDAPYANFQLDPIDDLLGARLMFWAAWKNRIPGFLYWGVEWGWRGGAQKTLNRIEQTTDCWWDKGLGHLMGGGCLIYPNPAQRQVHSTMLQEAMRDGLSDHEYFSLLNEAVQNAKAGKPAPRADEQTVPEIVKLLTQSTDIDPRIHMRYRERLARAIEGKNELVLSTIRLEAIRDGLEDHEYFVLLEKAIRKAEAGNPDARPEKAIARAKKLLTVPTEVVTSLTKWTRDDPVMRSHRDRVARAIEALSVK